jgi:hypothetical protein
MGLRLLVLPPAQHPNCKRSGRRGRHLGRRLVAGAAVRFGTGTAEFIICNRCGVYIGAIGDTPSGKRAVINTTCLDDRALFTREPAPTDHDGETTEDRLARRAVDWTPATVHR